MKYFDITEKALSEDNHEYKIIEQQYYIDENGNKYNVYGKYVILEPTQREKEVAKILGKLYGGKIKIIPRVNKPESIKTPDYIVNNRKFDLKQISGGGKYVIEGNLRRKMKQADNFIIDLTNAKINIKEAEKQIECIFKSKRFLWINEIILIKNNSSLIIYKRKPTANQK